MSGFSYYGYTQLAAAVTQPPHLKAICPSQTHSVAHSFPFSFRGDKFRQAHPRWCLMMSSLSLLRRKADPKEIAFLHESQDHPEAACANQHADEAFWVQAPPKLNIAEIGDHDLLALSRTIRLSQKPT